MRARVLRTGVAWRFLRLHGAFGAPRGPIDLGLLVVSPEFLKNRGAFHVRPRLAFLTFSLRLPAKAKSESEAKCFKSNYCGALWPLA